MNSISDIDLSPKKGKKYWKNCHREWREEFIYFLMLDRFHNKAKRHPVNAPDRHAGFGDAHQLRESCGGNIRVIIDHLDYTEQGLEGCGRGDWYIRECMFNPNDKSTNILDQQSFIYKHIAEITGLRQKESTLKFGRMFLREISSDSRHFHLPNCPHCTLAFSRILSDEEILVVYNSSPTDAKEEYILIDAVLNKNRKSMSCIYGKTGAIEILKHQEQGIRFVKIHLRPMQFAILKNK